MVMEIPAGCQVCGAAATTFSYPLYGPATAFCTEHNPDRAVFGICGLIGHYGRLGEPLACAFKPGHDGPHAWASLPTFANGEIIVTENQR